MQTVIRTIGPTWRQVRNSPLKDPLRACGNQWSDAVALWFRTEAGRKSSCRKFHQIGNKKRACIDWSGQVAGNPEVTRDWLSKLTK